MPLSGENNLAAVQKAIADFLEVALPAGVTGALALPVEANELRTIRGAEGVSGTHCADGVTAMDLASGRYEFRITLH